MAETQMRRNDCSELFLHARWLVTEGKKRKNKKQTGRTRGGGEKRDAMTATELKAKVLSVRRL